MTGESWKIWLVTMENDESIYKQRVRLFEEVKAMERAEGGSAPRPLKERQRQEREALILQVAEEVLLEKGYYETSIDEIAARVGIAKGTVYLHFSSKEDLVIAIFARDMRSFLQNIDEAVETKPTSQAKLEAILHLLYTGLF